MVNPKDGLLAHLGGDARALCRRAWWVFLVSGLASVAFAVLAFAQPVTAWMVVALFFAAAILVDGVVNVIGAIQHREKDGWWLMLLIGVLGALVGGYALTHPRLGMVAFVYLVAFQAMLLGVLVVALGYKVRAATQREWILYLTGALSILFGLLILANPAAGGISVILLIAGWALVTGLLRILFAFRIRASVQETDAMPPASPPAA
ncbi:MAG TPA: HdeD family acid-resistance protein [Steroidobacteraceae bacterium]|nr:HdeD family acid-resistance protein [Steroidobacteraceae bacterium]